MSGAAAACGRKILLVEDDGDLRHTVGDLLTQEGYSVVLARNGLEALGYLKNAATLPDLIVLDLMLPVMDGWEFRANQDRDARLSRIPVVVHSVHAARSPVAAVEVLAKPVSLDSLLETVKRHAG